MRAAWFTPVFNMAHWLPTWFDRMRKLDPQPDLYVFSENNSMDNSLELLSSFDRPHEVMRTWFVKDATKRIGPYGPMGHIMQLLLTRARQVDADYTFISAADVFPITRDTIDILTTWNVDCVAAQIMRNFGTPRGLYIAARWNNPKKRGRMIMRKVHRVAFDDTPAMVGFGLVALSRRLVQDRRINFTPVPGGCSEDLGYCKQMIEHGYKCCLDGLVKADHIIYDRKNAYKGWTVNEKGDGYVEFEYP